MSAQKMIARIRILAFALSLFALSSCGEDGGLKVVQTTCCYQRGEEVYCERGELFVGWQMEASRNDERQTAWQVVALDMLLQDTLYDSGRRIGEQSQHVVLPEIKASRLGFKWNVRVWDVDGVASPWSEWQNVRSVSADDICQGSSWIGAIGKSDAHLPSGRWSNTDFKKEAFKAAWADVDTLSAKSIVLRKAFGVKSDVADAVVYICGLGHYELNINGERVGDDVFAPLWSEYDKTVYFNAYDVTRYINFGELNAVNVTLGNGFFNVQRRGRYSKLQTSFGTPQLRMRLVVTYTDGSSQEVVSDSTWRWRLGPVTFNSIYGGESYDARMELPEACLSDYDDSAWAHVAITEGPLGKLALQTAPGVKIMERYDVEDWLPVSPDSLAAASKKTKRTVDSTVLVADMGQNLAGFPEIVVSGRKGDKVTILTSENLTAQGVCDQSQTGRQHYYEYTLKGDGDEVWHPQFSYYGFRYVQVEGAVLPVSDNKGGLPVLKGLQSCFVHSSAAEESSFCCDNELFTKTHRLIERAERSNMQAVLTDCPHREKLGWLEQDHLCGPSLLMNYDMSTYIPKVIRDIVDTQKDNGFVPTTAPQYVSFGNLFDDSPEWGSTLVILPFMYYERYGDSTLICRNYEAMRAYVDYLGSRSENGIVDFGLGDWYDYGPWRAGFSRNTSVACVATAHYVYDLQLLVRAARMVGNRQDELKYSECLSQVVNAFNDRFYKADSCKYDTGSQTANSLALYLGLTGDNKAAVLANLVEDIHAHGDRLTTGDVGNRYLFQTLAQNGLDSLLYTMLNHYETPGYGFQIKQGATTLTEQWDPRHGSSHNHFMMGQVDEWLFGGIAGIGQKEGSVGMRHLVIRPHLFDGLEHVNAHTTTLYGEVKVEADVRSIRAHVPIGCDADVVSLSGKTTHVGSGDWTISQR